MSSSQQPAPWETVDSSGVLRRRWPIAVAGALIGVVAALAYVAVAPKTYIATAAVYPRLTGANVGNGLQGTRTSNSQVNLDTEAQIITSGTVAGLAANMMHSPLSA